MSKIKMIVREYRNGMYSDEYTVVYYSGVSRRFDLRKTGKMIEPHFIFIMAARVRPVYNKFTGVHRYDVFEI